MLSNDIVQFKEVTRILIDSILFAQNGILHPRLVLLELEIMETRVSKLMRGIHFPIHIAVESLIDIVKISELTIILKNKQLFYCLKIPLPNNDLLTLFRAISLPTKQKFLLMESIFGYIWPENRRFR